MPGGIMSQATLSAGRPALSDAIREKRFFFYMSLVCAVLIFIGFAPSYYLKPVFQAPPPLSAMSHLHGLLATAWTLLFAFQAWLIGYERPMLHRRLGLMGAVLFGAVVAIGFMTAINAARLGNVPPASPPGMVFMAVPFFGMLGAAALGLTGLWKRAQRDAHMRYMMATFIAMTPPATHRIFVGAGHAPEALLLAFGIMNVLLGIAMLYDLRKTGRVHPAYLWSALVFLLTEAGIVWAFRDQESWMQIANWLVQV